MTLGEVSHKAIEKLIYKFLWNRNFNATKAPDRLKRKIMETSTALGGFGMINVRTLNDSLDLRSYARLLISKHPFFIQLNNLIDRNNFFDVKVNFMADSKLMRSINALNENRIKMLELPTHEMLAQRNFVTMLNDFKVINLLNPAGRQSIPYFLIHRRAPNCRLMQLTAMELRSIERYSRYPQLHETVRTLIINGLQVHGHLRLDELYLLKGSIVSICSLSSKVIRLSRINTDNVICIYKSGLILDPGEVSYWTTQMRKLTSTRHKNVLLRVAHGDVFSNERLNRFGLRDNPSCANCQEQSESPQHRILECAHARRAWEHLDTYKSRLGLNQLTDHSIENLLGAKDRLSKIELALQAEVLLKIISTGEGYDPERLVKSCIKVIGYSERLPQDLRDKLKNENLAD